MTGDLPHNRWFWMVLGAAALTAAYTFAFPSATLIFVAAVFAHTVLGLGVIAWGWAVWRRWRREGGGGATAAGFWWLLLICAGLGLFLLARGNTTQHLTERWLHAGFGAAALIVLAVWAWRRAGAPVPKRRSAWTWTAVAAIVVLVPGIAITWRRSHPNPYYIITNPVYGYTSMRAEDGGKKSPYFPGLIHTISSAGLHDAPLPENFFLASKSCKQCHAQIYREWKGSMHHFSSFNNQYYRQAIVYMQDVDRSTVPSQFCAGCHDPAVLLTGRWKKPIREQIFTPASQAGLGCFSCHSIVHVTNTLGDNAFTIADPRLDKLVESTNPILHLAYAAAVYLEPAPHDLTLFKPFLTRQTGEFCSACHKIHLDHPINDYRWERGFDEYDGWQGSGVSGFGARSFYYPPHPENCATCHMPRVRSNDPAAVDGYIRSHRFPAANTAVANANLDQAQLRAEEDFLKGAVSTDIFAISSEQGASTVVSAAAGQPVESSEFAQGEEASAFGSAPAIERAGGTVRVIAPLNETRPTVRPGSTIRVDVVNRNLRVGHFFPGGTIDAEEAWLELKATDGHGHVLFWSGGLQPDGAVDPTAHFYRSVLVDIHGHIINKRNQYAARTVAYVHVIGPGSATTVHYAIAIPTNVQGPITLTAKLNYRKFNYGYNQFAYGMQLHAGKFGMLFDDRPMTYDASTADVSGRIKRIPVEPIVTISRSRVVLAVGPSTAGTAPSGHSFRDAIRWDDYGIGLLLQGDLTGAETAFRRVTQIAPRYADGWLNVGRTLVQEGETQAARPYVAHALRLSPGLPRALYFRALIEKAAGNYPAALADVRRVLRSYPDDRVVLDQAGRLLFLEQEFRPAIGYFLRATAVDPENLDAHYNLMLCYRGAGNIAEARREEKLYERFKLDESSQAYLGPFLRKHPNINRERQPIHVHPNGLLSGPLESVAAYQARQHALSAQLRATLAARSGR
ncbi:MAG: tetratricopeptide repeat protein [Terriglobales bacterium]